jgi:hypothetical protein
MGIQEWIFALVTGVLSALIYDLMRGTATEWWRGRSTARGKGIAFYWSMALDVLLVGGFFAVMVLAASSAMYTLRGPQLFEIILVAAIGALAYLIVKAIRLIWSAARYR